MKLIVESKLRLLFFNLSRLTPNNVYNGKFS